MSNTTTANTFTVNVYRRGFGGVALVTRTVNNLDIALNIAHGYATTAAKYGLITITNPPLTTNLSWRRTD